MGRFLITVLIFVGLGPLIGGFVLALATKADFGREFFILSYIVGGLPALIAGIALGMVQMMRGSAGGLVTLVIGLAAGAGVALFMAGIRAASGFEWYLAILMLASVLAAFACWGIMRGCLRLATPQAGAAP